jgi:hypothetical protein
MMNMAFFNPADYSQLKASSKSTSHRAGVFVDIKGLVVKAG